jgi:hypothetical protein
MSWSVRLIGTPEAVAKALEEEEAKLSGQSLIEFRDAKPSLQMLIMQNFDNAPGAKPQLLKLTASGSGYTKQVSGPSGGTQVEQVNRSCNVSLESLGAVLT